MSSCPSRSASCDQAAGSVRSTPLSTRTPSASRSGELFRHTATTVAPRNLSCRTSSRPIPRFAPVTTAIPIPPALPNQRGAWRIHPRAAAMALEVDRSVMETCQVAIGHGQSDMSATAEEPASRLQRQTVDDLTGIIRVDLVLEAQACSKIAHLPIRCRVDREHPLDTALARHFDQMPHEQVTQSPALPLVTDRDRAFAAGPVTGEIKTAYADFLLLPCLMPRARRNAISRSRSMSVRRRAISSLTFI